MTAILKEDPPEIPDAAERQISPGLQRIVHRCLEKDSGQRFQSAKDLGFALESVSLGTTQTQTLPPIRGKRWRIPAALVAVLFLFGAGFGGRGLLVRRRQPEYRQLTFGRGYLMAARFTPDGQSVVYAAAWDTPQFRIYSSRVDGTEARDLGLPPAELLSVSRTGELAVALTGRPWAYEGGRLARAPLQGGAPRELLDDVVAADWSPDGSQLAVARSASGKCRLEYPIGTTLYETIGAIDHIRFSPQGDAIAFMDHPVLGDDRGSVVSVDLKGHSQKLTQEWAGEQGLAWSPDGREVWFTATSDLDTNRPLYAVTRSGTQRMIMRIPGGLYLEDVASDGRVLLTQNRRSWEVTSGQVGGEIRQLNWLQVLMAGSLSRDGKYAIVTDLSGSSGAEYGAYLANLDGSPPVLLGKGTGGGISPDNKWVTSIPINDTTKVLLLPVGVGEAKVLSTPGFHYRRADWASDGHRLVLLASESTHPLRFWTLDVAGTPPHAITPEGADGIFLTANHSDYVLIHDTSGAVRLYPIDGGEPKAVRMLTDADLVVGGAVESESLFVTPDRSAIPLEIFRVNMNTGKREHFVSLAPKDLAGIVDINNPIFSADERRYVFTQARAFSVLYIGTGVN